MAMFKRKYNTKSKRKGAPKKRNYKRGGLYRVNRPYAYKRLGKTQIIQNTAVLGQIVTNDASTITLGATSVDTVGYQFGAAMQFRLENVQSATDFVALYDQYRIKGVKVTIVPLSDNSTSQSSGFLPTLYWARDYDSANVAPATEADLRQRQDVKTMRLTGPRSIYISNPKCITDVEVQGAGVMLASKVENAGWIDCSDTNVMHNGLKMWFKNVDLRVAPGTITAFRYELTYYLQFRNPQ